ncbi:MAG: peptidylprolyl isomerase [Phycisphaerales bacterium]|nr:peptidylprolyl isomerase [Phycisphaerales bacterium]
MLIPVHAHHLLATIALILSGFASIAQGHTLIQPEPTRASDWEALSATAAELHERLSKVQANTLEGPLREELVALEAQLVTFNGNWPMDVEALGLLARVSMSLDSASTMDQAFSELLQLTPEDTQAGLTWAAYWANRDSERALMILDELISMRPESLIYHGARVKALLLVDPEGLDRRLETLVADENWEQAALMLEATARNDAPRAVALTRTLPSIEAAMMTNIPLAVAAARSLRMNNQFAQARAVLDTFPEGAITDPGHLYLWSDTCYADHDFGAAYELLQRIDMASIEKTRPGLHRRLSVMIPLRKTAYERWPAEFERRKTDSAAGTNPIAKLTISGRPVTVELYADSAPNTVGSFLTAAQLGIYDGHEAGQVHTGFRTIFGDREEGDPIPTWNIEDEHEHPDHRDFYAGTLVAYREAQPHSSDTRFYILHFPAPHLNGARTAFGHVVSGLDVIREMKQGDTLDRVEIIRPPKDAYEAWILDNSGTSMPLYMLVEPHLAPASKPAAEPAANSPIS